MTDNLLLDWPILATSLFNTIILTWLSLVVLLNADRRTPGVWLTALSLFTGAAFFVSHTALVGLGFAALAPMLNVWWHLGWIPTILLPLGWYLVTLWYSGFATAPDSALRVRHTPFIFLALALALGVSALLIFDNPVPSFEQALHFQLAPTRTLWGLPLLILAYPLYSTVCLLLAFEALLRPGPTTRLMGEQARHRARPWLLATNLALIFVTLLVAAAMLWFVSTRPHASRLTLHAIPLALFDLLISLLIALATLSVGQAVVAYEIFTGKSLPRRGLVRHWRRAILLAVGFSVVVGFSTAAHLDSIYTALLTAITIAVFYGLVSWRAYIERERYIQDLRPFVASQRLYDQLLTPDLPAANLTAPFQALCVNLLTTRAAALIPIGSLATLIDQPLLYPSNLQFQITNYQLPIPDSPDTNSLILFDAPPFLYALQLWSERGLIGHLLLGAKSDDSLYAQEEIEIARASGERFLDTLASAALAHRLVALQRARLAENQLLDHRARRVLHDDILPRLHAALLTLAADPAQAQTLLVATHRAIADLLHDLPAAPAPTLARLGLVGALRHLLTDEFENAFDEVHWMIDPAAEEQARALAPLAAETLYYAAREVIRNSARHARSPAQPLRLQLSVAWASGLCLIIEDNGTGLTSAPNPNSGGHGLALHSAMLAVVGGTLVSESQPGTFTRVVLWLPSIAN